MPTTVELTGVSKRFTTGTRNRSFQELFTNRRRLSTADNRQEFWAVRDVTLSLQPGQCVGLIGDNGAGKSTILKLIARVLEPTTGSVSVSGRLGCLIELGVGFHPDLSGRENVFLNAALMGIGRKEAASVYDEISDFAEIGDFMDVPVRHYSSGMYVRLGFAVATCVRPAVLLVDEALSVGDFSFQRKCLRRIESMIESGTTVVFVSHGLDVVKRICSQVLWLEHGRAVNYGSADQIISEYMSNQLNRNDNQNNNHLQTEQRWGSGEVRIVRLALLDDKCAERSLFQSGKPMIVRFYYHAEQKIEKPRFGLGFYHSSGFHLCGPSNVAAGMEIESIEGDGYVDCLIPHLPLLPDDYLVTAAIHDHAGLCAYDHRHWVANFSVLPEQSEQQYGVLTMETKWQGPMPSSLPQIED